MAATREDDDASDLHTRLTEIFTAAPPGLDDAPALQEVRRLCLEAKRRIDDSHCHAQLRQLERYARFFFSRGAHEIWSRDTGFGGNGLRTLVLQLLSAIELRRSQLDGKQLAASGAAHGDFRLSPRDVDRD
jgi:hypothetical protein